MKPIVAVFLALALLAGMVGPGVARNVTEFSCAAVTDVPLAECEALVALYNSTTGPGWTDHTNWLVTTTVDDWYGITINSGYVTEVLLNSNNLTGPLPASLGSLTNLEQLKLDDNHLSGGIPPQLGDLVNLIYLSMGENQLSGSIPPELGNLANLTYLLLHQNQLSGSIPPELGNLGNLMGLHLYDNQLSGSIPPELGNLGSLTNLRLYENQLSGSIPPELGNLGSLTNLRLYDNQLSGSIPPELGSLTSLTSLFLYENDLTGAIPPELGSLTSLKWLFLYDNSLTGAIPPELGNLTSLTTLILYDNDLTGAIPPELGNLTSLEALILYDNDLTGTIPPALGSLASLVSLDLHNNKLSGSIPSELGNLTSLGRLYLHNNKLSGDVPTSLTNLVNLCDPSLCGYYGLDLGYNRLNTPAAPPELAQFLLTKDPDWELTQAVSVTIGEGGGQLISNDGRTALDFPAGSLPAGTVVTYVPQPQPLHNYSPLGWAGLAFGLEVRTSSVFALPVAVTITYSDAALSYSFIRIREDTLALYWWDQDTSGWTEAVNTCTPPGSAVLDMDANTIQLSICATGEFALLGQTYPMIFLPAIQR